MSCESDYTKIVKSELAKGIRQDSLIFGITFGSDRESFYGKCFDLNRDRIVTQGTGFSVQYDFVDSVTHTHPTQMRMMFYPGFDSLNIINAMNIEFTYPGWTPGIRELQSDSLSTHVTRLLSNWYGGNDFVTVKISNQDIPVKVDGNRRIMVMAEDDLRVLVRMHDILHPEYRPKGLSMKSNEN